MYVQDFTGDKDAMLDIAFASPKLNPKKNPTVEQAMRVVGDVVTKHAKAKLAEEIGIDLLDGIAMYEVNNGEYTDIPEENQHARGDYESGMDDAVEAALEKWDDYLSADWLGKNTIETQVWLDTEDERTNAEKLAQSAAKEVFKQLTADKTPAQVLSSAGIVQADVEARLASPTPQTGDLNVDTNEVIAKIKAHIGKDFDQMAVFEDVEMIIEEDDEILAGSAGSRLGINQDDIEALQIAALDMDDAPSDIVKMIDDYKAPSAASKKKAAKAAKAEAKAEGETNGVPSEVFVALKECGAGDTAMAEELGVSRSTYTNYIKGKTHLVPDADQHALLRGELVERANKLLAGLAALDGTELTQVA